MTEDSTDEFKLTLTGEGISINKLIDRHTALAVVSAVMGTPNASFAPAASTTSSTSTAPAGLPSTSLREFITESLAQTNKEHIAAIGHYLLTYREQEMFSTEDVRTGFRGARVPLPKNLSRDMGKTAEAGWIDEAGKQGYFYLTNTGSKQVNNCFGRGGKLASTE